MKKVKFGIDVLKEALPDYLVGKRLGLLANHASKDSDGIFTKDAIRSVYGDVIKALFTPQHGFFGTEQDNMNETPHSMDERLRVPVYSLYSDTREPTAVMFDNIDALIVDLVDVGTRVYTFIYTMALCMKKAAALGKTVVVLDRPDPVSDTVEGNVITDRFTSFVGMYPIPMRHGMTIGETAFMFNSGFSIGCDLRVIKMEGYERGMYYDETGHKFPYPSPNMPTLDTAIVYPGQVIFEGTNISEGRGTTRPFEIIGAPFIDPYIFLRSLEKYDIKGVTFSEISFTPTFNKYAGKACNGLFIDVTDRDKYKPYITSLTVLHELFSLYDNKVWFINPPYEYEYDKLPFDIITGDDRIRESLMVKGGLKKIEEIIREGEDAFNETGDKYHLY